MGDFLQSLAAIVYVTSSWQYRATGSHCDTDDLALLEICATPWQSDAEPVDSIVDHGGYRLFAYGVGCKLWIVCWLREDCYTGVGWLTSYS